MITINMMCLPGGHGIGRFNVLSGSIWTTDCGQYHAYCITTDMDGRTFSGKLPKVRSGHRNPFHLLGDICDDIVQREDARVLESIDG